MENKQIRETIELKKLIQDFDEIDKKNSVLQTSTKKYSNSETTLYIYTRVSTKGQEDNTSLDSQRKTGEKLCETMGFKKNVLYNEGGKSSKYEDLHNRKKLDEIVTLIKRGKVKHLYVYDLSRLTRNTTVSFYIMKEMFRMKCKLYTHTGKYDFENSENKMLFTILSSVNNYENDLRRQKSITGKIESVKKGFWKGGQVNYGYKLEDKKVRIEKDERKIVKTMFEMYDNGKSSRDIQTYLSSHNIISRKGKLIWSLETIQSMLRNTIYKGYRDMNIGGFSFRQYNSNIVDSQLWNRCNDRMKSILQRKNQINKTTQFYMLRNLLFCKRCNNIMCGRKVNRKNNKNGENYYYCSFSGYRWKKTGNKINKVCDMKKSINITHTDDMVWESICNLFESSTYMKQMFKEETLKRVYNDIKDIDKEIKLIQQKRKQIKRDINNIQEGIVETHTNFYKLNYTIEMRDNLIQNLQGLIDKKEEEYNELSILVETQHSQRSWISWIDKLKSRVKKMRSETNDEKKREVCEKLIHKILVNYDEEEKHHSLEIRLKLPLFDDSIEYKNLNDKSEGYEIVGGNSKKTIKLRRRRIVKKKV